MMGLTETLRVRLPMFAAALWWGSLTVVGGVVVPQLFAHLPTPALAGNLAAKLFTAQTWVGLGCGVLLLMSSRDSGSSAATSWVHKAIGWILAGMLCALLMEVTVAPRILARENLALWHSLGSGLYGLQWLCAGVVLWRACDFRSGSAS